MSAEIRVAKTVRAKTPSVPFERIARRVLGPRFELSVVLCGDHLATRLNRTHRAKHYVPNVLTFPIAPGEGEVFLNLRAAEREAARYGVAVRERFAELFIHACLHLKGYQHGRAMERAGERLLREFR